MEKERNGGLYLEQWHTPLSQLDQNEMAGGIESELQRYLRTKDVVPAKKSPAFVESASEEASNPGNQDLVNGLQRLAIVVGGGSVIVGFGIVVIEVALGLGAGVIAFFTRYAIEAGAAVFGIGWLLSVICGAIGNGKTQPKEEPKRRFYQRQEQGWEEF